MRKEEFSKGEIKSESNYESRPGSAAASNDKKWKDNYGSQFMKKEEKKGE